jgi:hypothetical protein
MAYTKYSLTPADNNAAPPNGAPEGMLPSAVNDTMRDMMSQIRDVGDGIRGGTYTMTAPVITGGSITGVALSGNTLTNPVITGGSINNTTVGATTRSTGAFTTLASNGATTFTAGTASTSTTTGTAVITGGLGVSGRINAANFDGIVGANTAAAGNFTTLGATGVATFSAGTVSAPAITTTGDTNTGIFFPAADTIAFTEGGVESMRIDSSANVGIGTSSPVEKLTVSGAISLNTDLVLKEGTTARGYLFGTSTGLTYRATSGLPHIFQNVGTELMRIDSSGNVGIGTSSPVYQTQIYGSGQTTAALTDAGNKGGSLLLNTPTVAGGDGGALLIGAGGSGAKPFAAVKGLLADGGGNTTGSLAFSTRNATGDTALTERMRIDSSGNVIVGGTSTPFNSAGRGNITINGSSQAILGLTVGAADTGYIYHDGTNMSVQNTVSGILSFNTNVIERMRITSDGNLLVARTSSSRSARVSVLASSAVNDGIFVNGYGSGICNGASFSSASTVATAVEFLYNTTTVGAINTSTTATSYVTSSDHRLKENIAPMTGALDVVQQLKPVTYNWKVNGSAGQGFIAHELQAVVPDCVVGEKDAVDEKGKPKYQGVDASFLVATLTAAIQEQQTLIENLTTRLNALEGK